MNSHVGLEDTDEPVEEGGMAALQNMLTTQYVRNLINGAPCKDGNWELIITEALMNISVFNEDPTLFDKAVSFWRGHVSA